MNKELLKKYCENSCNEEELNSVLAWFSGSAGTPDGKSLLFRIWDEIQDEDDCLETDFDLVLDRIHHEINLKHSEKNLQEKDKDYFNFGRAGFLRILTRIAAILMLPVLVFGMYMSYKYSSVKSNHISGNQVYNEVFSSVDAITKVTLPDGSSAWLNRNSSLRYPATFSGLYRKVELKGEGFFEVIFNPENPFIVTAGEIEVKATGTVFNVMGYPEDDRVETSLISGRVVLQSSDADGTKIIPLVMKPGDLAIYNINSNKITTRTIKDDRNIAWKSGKLVFNKDPIGEVVKKLSRWFNVDIKIADPELLELTYTATFVHETLPQVMELIAKVSPVTYSISDREEISTGTFSRREVILKCRKK
jgi:transmembrane sensor